MNTTNDKKKFRLQAKNLFLTYPKCSEDKEKLLNFLIDHTSLSCRFVMIAQEHHEDGQLHLHAYVQLNDKCNIKSAKSLDFAGCHGDYKAAKGNYFEVKDYLEKEDTNCLIWGDPNTAKNKSEETKDGIARRNLMLASTPLPELVRTGEIRLEQYCSIKRSIQAYIVDSTKIGDFMFRRCIWLNDHPGVGKSRICRELFGNFYSKPQNKWWDGYTNQPVVVLEDFDKAGSCLSHYIKIWTDSYSFYGEAKGTSVGCLYSVFVITSNYWPNQIWKEEEDPELIQAVERRSIMVNYAQMDSMRDEIKSWLK